eukprot:gene30019-18096_t
MNEWFVATAPTLAASLWPPPKQGLGESSPGGAQNMPPDRNTAPVTTRRPDQASLATPNVHRSLKSDCSSIEPRDFYLFFNPSLLHPWRFPSPCCFPTPESNLHPRSQTPEPRVTSPRTEVTPEPRVHQGPSPNANRLQSAQLMATKSECPDNINRPVPAYGFKRATREMEEKKSGGRKGRILTQLMAMSLSVPDNIAVQCFTILYDTLSPELHTQTLKAFFKPALSTYHKVNLDEKSHINNWGLTGVAGLPEDGVDFNLHEKTHINNWGLTGVAGLHEDGVYLDEKSHINNWGLTGVACLPEDGVDVNLDEKSHINNWDLTGVAGLPEDGVLDLSKLGLPELSMRVRTGRNLKAFPLPASMTKDDRVAMEAQMGKVFSTLIDNPDFGGEYVLHHAQATPNFVDEEPDMSVDPYLTRRLSGDWPYGEAAISRYEQFNHLVARIPPADHVLQKGVILNTTRFAFPRLSSSTSRYRFLAKLKRLRMVVGQLLPCLPSAA